VSELKLEEIKERHERLKGPFGFCGLTVTLESIAEYTNFCGHYFPKLLEEITLLKARNEKLKYGLLQIVDIFSQVIPNSGHMYLGLINDAYGIADKVLKDCDTDGRSNTSYISKLPVVPIVPIMPEPLEKNTRARKLKKGKK
jgi:hypothetical protein